MKVFVQSTLEGNVSPQGICCEPCYTAKEERCVCRCGGRWHGQGRINLEPGESISTLAQNYWEDIKKLECSCGADLTGQPIKQYPHSEGWTVQGFEEKQWLYVTCPKCGYDWAIWKLGVKREA